MTTAQTKDILKLRLNKDAKLELLFSDLPFSSSDLVGALTGPLMSAARALNASLAGSIVDRLVTARVTRAQTRRILEEACKLEMGAKLVVLLSRRALLPRWFGGALRGPLLRAAQDSRSRNCQTPH